MLLTVVNGMLPKPELIKITGVSDPRYSKKTEYFLCSRPR